MAQPKFSSCNPKADVLSGKTDVKTECIERPLRRLFRRHGRYVAKHPYPFFFIPLILSGCLAIGMVHFELETDTEYLVTPKNGPAKAERKIVQRYFDFDLTGRFLPDRSPVLDGFADIVIKSRTGGNVLTRDHIADVIRLDEFVRGVRALDDNGKPYGFEDVCARFKGGCLQHPILMAYRGNASLVDGTDLTYPNHLVGGSPFFVGHILGGVQLRDNVSQVVKSAQATRLTYYVKYIEAEDQRMSNRWFLALTDALEAFHLPHIIIYHCETNSLAEQFNAASADITPKFAAPFTLLIMFSILSCMMNDWVRSKPWLAISGVLSAGLALVSVFGLLSAVGCRAVPQVGLVPFLTLGEIHRIFKQIYLHYLP